MDFEYKCKQSNKAVNSFRDFNPLIAETDNCIWCGNVPHAYGVYESGNSFIPSIRCLRCGGISPVHIKTKSKKDAEGYKAFERLSDLIDTSETEIDTNKNKETYFYYSEMPDRFIRDLLTQGRLPSSPKDMRKIWDSLSEEEREEYKKFRSNKENSYWQSEATDPYVESNVPPQFIEYLFGRMNGAHAISLDEVKQHWDKLSEEEKANYKDSANDIPKQFVDDLRASFMRDRMGYYCFGLGEVEQHWDKLNEQEKAKYLNVEI